MTVIQIKRSANLTYPTTSDLSEGELAYSQDKSNNGAGGRLFIESVNSGGSPVIDIIGGKYYTTIVDAATAANTANAIVRRDTSGNFTAGIITATLYGTANAVPASGITGDIALGSQTSGAYVANLVQGTGISLSGLASEGATPTIALATSGVTANTYGGQAQIPVITVDQYGRITTAANTAITVASTAFSTISVSGQSDIVADSATDTLTVASGTGVSVTTNASTDTLTVGLSTSGVSASTYGGANVQSVLTVDTYGRVTSASNVTTVIALGTNTTGAYVANLVAGTGISLSGLGDEGTTPTITNSGVTSITGTSNQITASASSGAVTLSLPTSVSITDLTLAGNLTVNGTVTTINSTTVSVDDKNLELGSTGTPSDATADGGGITLKGTTDKTLNWVNATDSWTSSEHIDLASGKVFKINTATVLDSTGLGTSIVNSNLTSVGTITSGTWSATTIATNKGGTGLTSFTANGVPYASTTSALSFATGSAGQVLQLNTSGVPVFAGLDGGTY